MRKQFFTLILLSILIINEGFAVREELDVGEENRLAARTPATRTIQPWYWANLNPCNWSVSNKVLAVNSIFMLTFLGTRFFSLYNSEEDEQTLKCKQTLYFNLECDADTGNAILKNVNAGELQFDLRKVVQNSTHIICRYFFNGSEEFPSFSFPMYIVHKK